MTTIRQRSSRATRVVLMRPDAGLTLWGLLRVTVVVSIVSIVLISIAMPCPCGYRIKGRATKAISEIHNIELAFAKMFSDTGTTNFREFFDDDAFAAAVARLGEEKGMDAFAASREIYTDSAYVLLRKGRSTLKVPNDYRETLRPEMVARLGISYNEDLAFDPWGTLYQIYPGPWPEEMGPIPFRTYLAPLPNRFPGEIALERDALTFECLDIESDGEITVGWPAPRNRSVYIWSLGANLESGQANYDPTQEYAAPPMTHYEQMQEPEIMGGGDDINNWDKEQTFMRFYN